MREFNALAGYPEPATPRKVMERGIANRLAAAQRGQEFFDGERANGYGGMVDDGRWHALARLMAAEYGLMAASSVYGLDRTSRVLQVQCEKAFLLREFQRLGLEAVGTETSVYALEHAAIVGDLVNTPPMELPHPDQSFDLVLALGAVYTLNLADAVLSLREIARVGRRAFVTLAAYEGEEDLRLLRQWSLLGTTILRREEWLQVLRHAGYEGDYTFVTARTLNLSWS